MVEKGKKWPAAAFGSVASLDHLTVQILLPFIFVAERLKVDVPLFY